MSEKSGLPGVYLFHVYNHEKQEWTLFSCRANRNGGPGYDGLPAHDQDWKYEDWSATDALHHCARALFVSDSGCIIVIKDRLMEGKFPKTLIKGIKS